MFKKVKKTAQDAQQFVKRNETFIVGMVIFSGGMAIGATSGVKVNKKAMRDWAYKVGYEHGQQMAVTALCVDFIEKNELTEQFLEHAKELVSEGSAYEILEILDVV